MVEGMGKYKGYFYLKFSVLIDTEELQRNFFYGYEEFFFKFDVILYICKQERN